MSLVYYLLDATYREMRVKIGYSTNLSARLKALTSQTMSRQPPTVLALEEGDIRVERKRHAECADAWLIGEWFQFSHPLVQALIYEHGDPFAYLAARPHLWNDAGGWGGFVGWLPQSVPPGVREGKGEVVVDEEPTEPGAWPERVEF